MSKSLKFLGLLAILLAAWGTAPANRWGGVFESEEESRAVTAAETALERRDFDLAYELANRAVEEFPESFEALRVFGSACSSTNRIREVSDRFTLGSSDPLQAARAYYLRGWTALLHGEARIALESLDQAAKKLGREDFEVERARLVARRNLGAGDRESLMADYRAFVRRYHDVGLAHLSYVNSFNFLDPNPKNQKRAIRDAMDAPEQTPELYVAAAGMLEDDFWFDSKDALAIVEKGLEQFPESRDLGIRKVYYLRRMGRTAEALAWVQRWRLSAPNDGEFGNAEAQLLSDLGRYDETLSVLENMESLTYQPDIVDSLPFYRSEILQLAGRRDEAIETLIAYVADKPGANMAGAARQVLYALQTSPETASACVLPMYSYLQQKGNYCGPASISMLLSFWGLPQGQDEVAERVYTGIAGTPPQVLHHFIRSIGMESVEFEGNEDNWKALLDAGYPILWLQMNGTEGGHYRVVTGYDDARKRWFVHDPNLYSLSEIPYDRVDDTWPLPSLRRSIAIYPPEKANDPALATLAPTPILHITNWVMYIATGANLFVGLFPALPLNALVALLLGGICAGLFRRITFPPARWTFWKLALLFASPIIILNLVVVGFRLNEAVSALLSLHLALVTLVVLLAVLWIFQRIVHDVLSVRESLGLSALVISAWLALAFIDQDPWETRVPVAIFLLGLPAVLYPRLLIRRGEVVASRGDANRAMAILKPWGLDGARYFSAIVAELDCMLSCGRFDRVAKNVEAVLALPDNLPGTSRDSLELYRLYALALRFADEDLYEEATAFVRRQKLSRRLRLTAEALVLYIDSELLERGVGQVAAKKIDDEIDRFLVALNAALTRPFPGLPVRRSRVSRPIQGAAFLLALSGAMRLASAAQNSTRRRDLWIAWSARYGLQLRLLRGFEEHSHPVSSTTVPRYQAEKLEVGEEREKYPSATT